MAKKTTTESKEITIDQENFKEHGEAFVESMLREMLTFDSPDDLFNEDSGDYEYFGETLVPGDESGNTRAVSWMESWVNPGFDKWAKGYGGTKTKKELESFMLEAERDYIKAAEDVLNDAFNAVPLAKKLKATFSIDTNSFGDYGYVVSMDKADFEKAQKTFIAQNITANGKPVKVNDAIFYKLSKDALIKANYKEAKDMDIRCAVCMHYRGFGQFCPRFWVSVNPDFVCDKQVRLPAKAELKIANGNAAKSNEYDFAVNVFTQEGKKIAGHDDFKVYETTEKRAIESMKRDFVKKYPGMKFAYLLVAKNDKFYGSKLPPYSGEFNSNEAKKAGNMVRTTGISKMPLVKKDIRMIAGSIGARTMKADAIDLILDHIKNIKNKQEAIDTVQKVLEAAYKLTVHSKRMIITRDDVDLVLKMK
jgi:histone H3/H4